VEIVNPNPSDEERRHLESLLTPESIAKLQEQMAPLEATPGSTPIVKEGIHESAVDLVPVTRGRDANHNISKLHGRHMFTLGPVYFMLNINHSIVELFRQTPEGAGVEYNCYDSGVILLPDIKGWETTVESVPAKWWPALTKFLGECGFFKKESPENPWSLHGTNVLVTDATGSMYTLTVFTPAGVDFVVEPAVTNPAGSHIRFMKVPRTMDTRLMQITKEL